MSSMDQITDETIALIQKAQTAGLTYQSGLYGYDLSGVVSWVPVLTPTRDRIGRRQAPQGSDAARWRVMLNANGSQPNPFTGADGVGGDVNFNFHSMLSGYFPVRQRGHFTYDSVDASRGYDDVKARALAGSLMQWRLAENKAIIGGQQYALPALTLPALTTSTTGGSIAATTAVYVNVQARSGYNYYWGGSGTAVAANITTGAGGTNTVTIPSWTSVAGAVAYDIFAGPAAGTQYYVTTVTTNAAYTLKAIPTQNAAVPALPSLSTTVPTVATSDGSYNANAFNGLIASIVGDWTSAGVQTKPGSGDLGSGATTVSLGGAAFTGNGQGITEIDNFLLNYFQNTGGESPDWALMNGQEAQNIKSKVLSTSAAVTYLEPQGDGRVGATVGGSVGRYINGAAGGQSINIVVDPHLPPGRVIFGKDSNPYPEAGESSVFEVRTLREVAERPYGNPPSNTPGEWWDVSSYETFINRAPVLCGIITDVANG